MARNRKKRRKTKRKAARPSPAQSIIVSELPLGPTGANSTLRYIAAHQLLPPDYPDMACNPEEQLSEGLRCLGDPNAGPQDKLAAIMLLAHTADPRALSALQRYAASGAVHADMAELGADECAMWLGDRNRSLLSAPGITLN